MAFQCGVKTDWKFLSGKEEGVAPPQGSHDWSAVVRMGSLRARQVCKAKDMSACGNSEKGHQQSRTTQGLLDFDCAGAPQKEAEEDDEQRLHGRRQRREAKHPSDVVVGPALGNGCPRAIGPPGSGPGRPPRRVRGAPAPLRRLAFEANAGSAVSPRESHALGFKT